jgi:hypothetical protein
LLAIEFRRQTRMEEIAHRRNCNRTRFFTQVQNRRLASLQTRS